MEKFSMYPNFLKNEGEQAPNPPKTSDTPPLKTEQEAPFIAQESRIDDIFTNDEYEKKRSPQSIKPEKLSSAGAMLGVISTHEKILRKIQAKRNN